MITRTGLHTSRWRIDRVLPPVVLILSAARHVHASATEGANSINDNTNDSTADTYSMPVDTEYPGTAVQRLNSVHKRVASLTPDQLSGDWDTVARPSLLWAGGLKDLRSSRPGQGYTGHSFNDYNHCDLTTMLDDVSDNENKGQVDGIAYRNQLGPGVRVASLPELGPGGSWSTCMMGCNRDPPQDVAHLQFRSRIAFKLVWLPPAFTSFVLLDDSGRQLAAGTPTGRLPAIRERQTNYKLVQGSKYDPTMQAAAATKAASGSHDEL